LDDELSQDLLFEISQIDRLLDYSKPLFDSYKMKTPDSVELCAGAMVLHSFYGGIETILKSIFRHYNRPLPTGWRWHMDLLCKAFVSDFNGKPVFLNVSQEILDDYMKFRHFARHCYCFQIKWEKMRNLTTDLYSFWESIKSDLHTFIKAS